VKFLRTVPTRRLLVLIASVVGVIVAGTAIAVAAIGNGPVPRREPLAVAIHQALAAPAVTGISARISYTNNLIDATDFQGPTDPLLQGASGRLWLTDTPGDQRLRIELQTDNGDAQIVYDNGQFSIYDPAAGEAYVGSLPAKTHTAIHHHARAAAAADRIPSLAAITRALSRISKRADVSGAIPGDVAGQAAYTVKIAPERNGGLVGDLQLAWDAVRGVPLQIGIYAKGDTTPVLELGATDISYGPVSASVFDVSPPPGTRITHISVPTGGHKSSARARREVARRLPFTLADPATASGLERTSVGRLGRDGALVYYGRGLSGVAVLEQAAHGSATGPPARHDGFSIPTVSINGATAQQLQTPLGTVLRFTRSGVAYTVIGSVKPATADAVARGL
jgi:hypothetical protein